MHQRKIWILAFLCCVNACNVLSNENVDQFSRIPGHTSLFTGPKTSLNVVQGTHVQIQCDILCSLSNPKWIEWRRNNSTSPVLVKYVNYEPYVHPGFSNRLTSDVNGSLLINPVLIEDSAIYKCTTYTLKNHVATFLHGTEVELNIFSDKQSTTRAIITQPVRLGFPALLDCQIKPIKYLSQRQLMKYTWTKNNIDVTIDARFTVLISGSLFIRATRKADAGIYKCMAKTFSDTDLPMVYRGVNVNLDILYIPAIVLIKRKIEVSFLSDVYLPCKSKGNPSLIYTTWLWNKEPLPKSFQSQIFHNGTLYMKNVKKDHEGNYTCIPSNEVGLGMSAKTTLKVEALIVFTLLPPKTLTVSLGDRMVLSCKAGDARIDWRKVDSSLPEYRSTSRGGSLIISDVHMRDSGGYECKAMTSTGSLSQFVELIVIPTPIAPVITNINVLSTSSAIISWRLQYVSRSKQGIEIWYRLAASDDNHWQTIKDIHSDMTSHRTIQGLEPRQPYLFSLRGVNAAGFGTFSNVYYTATTSISSNYRVENMKGKPLSPTNLHVNITHDGYLISWSYIRTPGRPVAQFFTLEYRVVNASVKWRTLAKLISWNKRQSLINKDKLRLSTVVHEFRMFSFGEMFSDPSHVVAFVGSAVFTKPLSGSHNGSNRLAIICIVTVGAIAILTSLAYCYCYKKKSKRRLPTVRKIDRAYTKCAFPYSSTESRLSDSENDQWELNDVKLLPYMSTFVQESQENVVRSKKAVRKTTFDYQSVTLGDEYVDRAASSLADKSNYPEYQNDIIPGRYLQHIRVKDAEPTAFKTGCLLPEFPELRDSYDQFCTMLSANSSNEDLEVKRSIKYLDKTETSFSSKTDTRYSPEEFLGDEHLACKRRKKTILEEASDAHEKYQRWSMPEFTKLWYETVDSDTENDITTEPTTCSNVKQLYTDRETHSNRTDNYFHHFIPLSGQSTLYTDLEEQISGSKESESKIYENRKLTRKDSVSCPNIVCSEPPASVCYDSSGFSDNMLLTSTPEQPNSPVNLGDDHCTSWRETEFNHLPDIDESSDVHDTLGSASCEASVYTSDSGYSGMSSGTRDSPEGEEQYNDNLNNEDDRVTKPQLYRNLKDLEGNIGELGDNDNKEDDRNHHNSSIDHSFVCDHTATRTSSYPDVIVKKNISEASKNKHCAQLVKEFRVIKNLPPATTCTNNYTLYRTYEV